MLMSAAGDLPETTSRPVRLSPKDLLWLGVSGVLAQRTRAALSALGIAIGTAAIIAVLGVSASSQSNLLAELGRLGNLLTVSPGQTLTGATAPLPAAAMGMISRIPPVQSVTSVAVLPNTAVYRSSSIPSDETGGITVAAADTNLLSTLGGGLEHGEFLNAANDRYPAVVLGFAAARTLGIPDLAVPAQVYLGSRYFTVVGILKPVSLAPEIDDSALIGFPAANSLFGYGGAPTKIYVRAYPDQITAVESVLAATANPAAPESVSVSRPSEVLTARAAAKGALTGLVLGLGAVALLVGGVGVANIMVISVLERRGEIGLRRALGATRGQIGTQFFTESVLLASMGGLVGILSGIAATVSYARAESLPAAIPANAVWAGFAAAICVGALAGLYPAIRASRLSPAGALRSG